jgi:TfoX/Sxy family transcriptional regulator of competence genes
MAYNETLAQRMRAELVALPGLSEKKMFGGIGFLLHGNMACGVHGDEMIVRVGPQRHAEVLSRSHVRPFDMTGRPMAGWVMVSMDGLQAEEDFLEWLRWGMDFALSLPPK